MIKNSRCVTSVFTFGCRVKVKKMMCFYGKILFFCSGWTPRYYSMVSETASLSWGRGQKKAGIRVDVSLSFYSLFKNVLDYSATSSAGAAAGASTGASATASPPSLTTATGIVTATSRWKRATAS